MGKKQKVAVDPSNLASRGDIEPNNSFALASRGDIHRRQGNYALALTDLNQALAIQPNDVAALARRGDTYRGLGDYKSALTDLNQALTLQPNDPSFLRCRRDIYSQAAPQNPLASYQTLATLDDLKAYELEKSMGKNQEVRTLLSYTKLFILRNLGVMTSVAQKYEQGVASSVLMNLETTQMTEVIPLVRMQRGLLATPDILKVLEKQTSTDIAACRSW